MKKHLFISLIALATTTYSQECTPVTEINEDFSTFNHPKGALPQNCWSNIITGSSLAYAIPNSHLQAYAYFSANLPIYFVTPEVAEFTENHKLSFDTLIANSSFTGNLGTIQVGTLTDRNDASTFVPLTEEYELVAPTEIVHYENISLGSSDTSKFIAFKIMPRINHLAVNLDNVVFKDESLATKDIKVIDRPTLYPNPAIDAINIQANSKVLSYEIYDLTGRKVGAGNNSEKINVSNLPKGSYMINIVTKDGNTTSKFIKK